MFPQSLARLKAGLRQKVGSLTRSRDERAHSIFASTASQSTSALPCNPRHQTTDSGGHASSYFLSEAWIGSHIESLQSRSRDLNIHQPRPDQIILGSSMKSMTPVFGFPVQCRSPGLNPFMETFTPT